MGSGLHLRRFSATFARSGRSRRVVILYPPRDTILSTQRFEFDDRLKIHFWNASIFCFLCLFSFFVCFLFVFCLFLSVCFSVSLVFRSVLSLFCLFSLCRSFFLFLMCLSFSRTFVLFLSFLFSFSRILWTTQVYLPARVVYS